MSGFRLPAAPGAYTAEWGQQLIDDLETRFLEIEEPTQTGYQMSNVTVTRTLNADSTTLAEVADVLATLIEDLQAKGRLG